MAILIANPIYDTVFKYLMEDLTIAKELIQEIIHEEIIHIEPKPQESTVNLGEKLSSVEYISHFTVYRLDYIAIIKTSEGEKKVLIELQKAKLATDIMRFRKYIGEQYTRDSYPIITIYFLGYPLDENLPKVLEVSRVFKDRISNQTFERKKNEFIDSLTHDTFIIQLKGLKTDLQNRLEKVLSIFSQAAESFKEYVLKYEFPVDDELQKKIAERLRYAASDSEIKKKMDIEQDILIELQNLERKINEQEEMIQKKDKALEEKDKALEEKDKALGEKDKALEEKDKALEEKDKLIQELLEKLKNS